MKLSQPLKAAFGHRRHFARLSRHCPSRNGISSSDWQLEYPATMMFPPVAVEIGNMVVPRFNRGDTIQARVTPMLVVVALIIPELFLQVIPGPEEGLIQ